MAYSVAIGRAKSKYRAKAYDQIAVQVPKGMRDVYRAQAERSGMSLNAYIVSLLDAEVAKAAKSTQDVSIAPLTCQV